MKKRIMVIGLVAAMLVLTLSACGGGGSSSSGGSEAEAPAAAADDEGSSAAAAEEPAAAEGETYNFKFVSPDTMNGTDVIYWNAWNKFLYNESGGRVTLELYGNGAMVPAGEELSAIKDGLGDMGKIDSLYESGNIVFNQAVCLPDTVGWPGATQASLIHLDLYNNFPELEEEFTKNNLIFLYGVYGGPTDLNTTKKPVHTLEDAKGLNQIEIGEYASEAAKLMGMNPLSFPLSENADALAKGVADGMSVNYNAIGNYYSDVINYSTQTALVMPSLNYLVFNLDVWNSLPADIQALFQGENLEKANLIANYVRDKGDVDGKAKLNEAFIARGLPEVYVLPEDELNRWKEVVAPVKDMWIEDVGTDIGTQIQDHLSSVKDQYAWTDDTEAQAEAIIAEWNALPLDPPTLIS